MESKRFRIGVTLLLCAGVSSAARAQPPLPWAEGPGVAVTSSDSAKSSPAPSERPPDEEVVKLKPPPLEAGDVRFPINLGTALRLADDRPLVVAAAQATAWRAEADLQKAKVLWVPTFNFGLDYIRHDGFGPD